ncbi:MAG: pseudouridine-5'-phosphate glycosidase [Planctomycetota bacterium]|nr:pseudouridine-5'-phosphate glycosidase [Planctomycetota bacterium]
MTAIKIRGEVSKAMRLGRPVVALESAVITSGLPHAPLERKPASVSDDWQENQPANLEVARLMERTVRAAGAIPATIALIDGVLHVGLDDDQLKALALDDKAGKISSSGLSIAMAKGLSGGTTVSATLAVCGRVGPIRFFATGGVGGVHRDWQTLPDISGDLKQLAITQTCVVSAGAKSILDLPATLQWLESLNIPVIGFRTSNFPFFHHPGDDRLPVPYRCDTLNDIVRGCQAHWLDLASPTGVLVANPIPTEFALDHGELEQAIERAEQTAHEQQITGAHLTPFLLEELSRLTGGLSVEANIALLESNAQLASELALEWSQS